MKNTPPSKEPTDITLPRLALTLDLELYLGQLEDWDISESQKVEFITTFWNLLVSFAELGFGIHPAQQAQNMNRKKFQKSPENLGKGQKNTAFCAVDMLCSEPYQRTRIITKREAHSALDNKDSKPEGARS